jgi:hypothetical protein
MAIVLKYKDSTMALYIFFLLGSFPFQLLNILALALGKFQAFLGHINLLTKCCHCLLELQHIYRHIPIFRPPSHCVVNPQEHFHDLQTLIEVQWLHTSHNEPP